MNINKHIGKDESVGFPIPHYAYTFPLWPIRIIKPLLFLVLILKISTLMGQNSDQTKNKIQVTSNESIDLNDIQINLGEGLGWHTTIIPIFHNGQVDVSHFPVEAGIYNLIINYQDSLFYNEVVLYRLDPKFENLSFNFYTEYNRVFCQMNSIFASELNKEIVLNKITNEMKEIIDKLNEKK